MFAIKPSCFQDNYRPIKKKKKRIDWLDLDVQGTLKILLRHHSSKASILWHSAFFMVQLSHPYNATGKIIALTIQIYHISNIKLIYRKQKFGGIKLPSFINAKYTVQVQ